MLLTAEVAEIVTAIIITFRTGGRPVLMPLSGSTLLRPSGPQNRRDRLGG